MGMGFFNRNSSRNHGYKYGVDHFQMEPSSMKEITIYTMATCAACKAVKDRLNEHKVKFKEIMIYRDIAMDGFKYRFPEAEIVPLILIGNEQIKYNDFFKENPEWAKQS